MCFKPHNLAQTLENRKTGGGGSWQRLATGDDFPSPAP
jgi:hypothetical protein